MDMGTLPTMFHDCIAFLRWSIGGMPQEILVRPHEEAYIKVPASAESFVQVGGTAEKDRLM